MSVDPEELPTASTLAAALDLADTGLYLGDGQRGRFVNGALLRMAQCDGPAAFLASPLRGWFEPSDRERVDALLRSARAGQAVPASAPLRWVSRAGGFAG